MEFLTMDRVQLLTVFVIPGFISMTVWHYITPSGGSGVSNSLLHALSFSSANLAFFAWPIGVLQGFDLWTKHPVWAGLFDFIVLFVAPVAWPFLIRCVLNWNCLRDKVPQPFPTAWELFFGYAQPCRVIIHLKSGKVIGGIYAGRAGASSFPNTPDIYLSEAWLVNENRQFEAPLPQSMGLWISKDAFDWLEFFHLEEGKNGGATETA